MKRKDMINDIELLYPPDDNGAGRELLITALCQAWRELPKAVITELRIECIRLDHKGVKT